VKKPRGGARRPSDPQPRSSVGVAERAGRSRPAGAREAPEAGEIFTAILALTRDPLARDLLMELALERVLPHWHLQTVTLFAAMPTRKHVPMRTRAFVDFLASTFGQNERDPWLAAAGCESC